MSDIDGKSLRASNLIFKIKKIFNNLKEESDILEEKNYLSNEKNIYEKLIFNINNLNKNNIEKNKYIFLFYK